MSPAVRGAMIGVMILALASCAFGDDSLALPAEDQWIVVTDESGMSAELPGEPELQEGSIVADGYVYGFRDHFVDHDNMSATFTVIPLEGERLDPEEGAKGIARVYDAGVMRSEPQSVQGYEGQRVRAQGTQEGEPFVVHFQFIVLPERDLAVELGVSGWLSDSETVSQILDRLVASFQP